MQRKVLDFVFVSISFHSISEPCWQIGVQHFVKTYFVSFLEVVESLWRYLFLFVPFWILFLKFLEGCPYQCEPVEGDFLQSLTSSDCLDVSLVRLVAFFQVLVWMEKLIVQFGL